MNIHLLMFGKKKSLGRMGGEKGEGRAGRGERRAESGEREEGRKECTFVESLRASSNGTTTSSFVILS